MSLLLLSDFIGEYKIPQTSFDNLQGLVDKYEKKYLVQLMGKTLYDLFIADLDASVPQVPQTAIYILLWTPEDYDDGNCIIRNEGMRVMLKQLIYFHAIRELQYDQTTVGVMQTVNENSALALSQGNIVTAYNEGVTNYHAIQWLINDNSTDYPSENMQPLGFTSGI